MSETAISIFLLISGVILTCRQHFYNPNVFLHCLICAFRKRKGSAGDVSAFSGLCTALGGCVGTGNIIGVTTCIMNGGPGSVFWIWVCAFFSIATKYTEVLLSAKAKDENGKGNPLFYIVKYIGKSGLPLGVIWCVMCFSCSVFSGAAVQANAISEVTAGFFPENVGYLSLRIICGIILCVITFFVLSGGYKRVTAVSSMLVPPACLLYVCMCICCIVVSGRNIPDVIVHIIKSAFNMKSAAYGGTAFAFFRCMRLGISLGIFSNEAGMGTSPLALSGTDTDARSRAGMSMWEVIIDTFVICTVTALSVLCCVPDYAVFSSPVDVVVKAFSCFIGERAGRSFLSICIILFAYTSVLGWSYYGAYCGELLFGTGRAKTVIIRVLFCLMLIVGCLFQLGVIWDIAATLNMLLAVPNVFAMLIITKNKSHLR